MQTVLSLRLKAARLALHPLVSQRDVATKLGKSASAVNLWEKGKTEPGASDLVALSIWYQVSTDWLLGIGSDNKSVISAPEGGIFTVPVVSSSSLARWHLDSVKSRLQTTHNYPPGTAAAMLVESAALASILPVGAYAVISKAHTIEYGHTVLASVSNSPEPILRKFIREGGEALLVADDARYASVKVSAEVHLIGRVTELSINRLI